MDFSTLLKVKGKIVEDLNYYVLLNKPTSLLFVRTSVRGGRLAVIMMSG